MVEAGFKCEHCGRPVPVNDFIGTKNRNHCPFCLWSKHVDSQIPGDRQANCHGGMQPVGLTYKQAGVDKYGKPRQGELMLIHVCSKCGKVSINRIAADDDTSLILGLLDAQALTDKIRQKVMASDIKILDKTNSYQIKTLLFGKTA